MNRPEVSAKGRGAGPRPAVSYGRVAAPARPENEQTHLRLSASALFLGRG